MKITNNKDHYLLENEKGSYHLDTDVYENLGKVKAIELATNEIDRKFKADTYNNASINFDQARELGFCEYGINDFCEKLDLDKTKSYTILELKKKLTPDAFIKYPSECKKLFGKNVLDIFGGVKKLLSENKTQNVLGYVLENDYLSDNILHELACGFAESTLVNFEKEYPDDKRPRQVIEAKRLFIKGEITTEQLEAARSAASSAAWSAESAGSAYSAARSAESAARSAARSAASSASFSAASSAEIEKQINTVLKHL